MRYVQEITDFIFVRHAPRKADIAFLPGSAYAQTAIEGARMYRQGYVPLLLPSGRFSVTLGRFPGPQSHEADYPGPYESEWAFYRDVLMRGGVPEQLDALRRDLEDGLANITEDNLKLSQPYAASRSGALELELAEESGGKALRIYSGGVLAGSVQLL